MAAIPNQQRMPSISMDGLVTIVGAVLLLLAIIYFNNDLHYRLDTKIDTVRTELKADIDNVRTELKADIDRLETDIESVRAELKADFESARMELSADIQRLDDRLFAVVNPAAQHEESES
ncbi:MAG: hypothetical protein OXI34_10410 [Chloroflexota bacterium]|nr:hypothetical protein [Chloroflexota bacterium]MDE2853533.1 hypothetical protein [Chloroflexota bacterium]MDE2948757.1 hypothetical protein [Chloroflexota bacterium]